MVRALRNLIERKGMSIGAAARALGISKNSAISKYHRLTGHVAPSRMKDSAAAADRLAKLERERVERSARALARFKELCRAGVERDDALRRLRADGAVLTDLSAASAVSVERVRQICMAD